MASTNLLTYSGNRITVEFDGQIIGLVQSVRLSDSYGLESASGIGDIHTVEWVPSRAEHSVSVTAMTLFRGNMRQAGISIENGDAAMNGLVFDIVLYGKETPGGGRGSTRVRTIRGCSFDSGDVEVTAHRIVMQTAQFKALDVVDVGI